jgi:predicted PurR-regulated permease PerM
MNDSLPKNSIYDTAIRMLFLTLIVAWCLLLIYPFASVILWSSILAVAFLPLHRFLTKKMGGRPNLASFLIVFLILAVVIVPLVVLIITLVNEVGEIKAAYFTDTINIPAPDEKIKSFPIVGHKLYDFWLSASLDEEAFLSAHKDQILSFGGNVVKGILAAFGGIIQLILSLCIAGVLLARKDVGITAGLLFKKIAGERGDEFADLTVKTVSSVLNGVLGEGFVLAMMNGVVFVLAGVPYPGFLTLLAFVFAVVQLPGLLLSLPIMVFFFVTKATVPAILWSVTLFLVGLSDNILTPLMLGKGAPVPMLVIFIGVIGGFVLSGFVGLFTGAIVLSVGYKLFTEWMSPENSTIQE